jgi:NAD(P)-dependent dehydrogenase (short-subunit alcohol dehydrogenase family)
VPVAERAASGELSGALPSPPVPQAAVVTGGARRIGRALCLALADIGFAVAVHHHRSQWDAEAVVAEIGKTGGRAMALAADLADEGAVKSLLRRAADAFGPIGVLVNNASIFESDTVMTASRDSWDRHLAINLRAPFVLMQEFAARLPAESGGVIVNLLDERVWNLTPYFVSYTLSKSGFDPAERAAKP